VTATARHGSDAHPPKPPIRRKSTRRSDHPSGASGRDFPPRAPALAPMSSAYAKFQLRTPPSASAAIHAVDEVFIHQVRKDHMTLADRHQRLSSSAAPPHTWPAGNSASAAFGSTRCLSCQALCLSFLKGTRDRLMFKMKRILKNDIQGNTICSMLKGLACTQLTLPIPVCMGFQKMLVT
jgi:hypothetical protein